MNQAMLKQQMTAAKLMQEQTIAIQAIAEKYGGVCYVRHDEIRIEIPEEHMAEVMAEIKQTNKRSGIMPTVTLATPEFITFLAGCKKVSDDNFQQNNPHSLAAPAFRSDEGKRYVKVVRNTSAYCFIDKTNGDVLKAASWKSPAKHARGNIFDEHNGLKHMGPYGPAYLRG